MTRLTDWEVVDVRIDPHSDERLFFTDHEWDTVAAAAARIIPTDHDPGAREARVIVFIDRYLSGIDYHYAAADGSGFLRLAGKQARSAREKNSALRRLYRDGIVELDAAARDLGGSDFASASEQVQDAALERLSGRPKPTRVSLETREVYYSRLQGSTDEGMPFFDTLAFHVRQGFYADPIYGGNAGRVGWEVIGFPGPESLKDTMDGTYTTAPYFVQEFSWEELLLDYKKGNDQ
jgi:gluconate 2-dehydrogenase gamma chain